MAERGAELERRRLILTLCISLYLFSFIQLASCILVVKAFLFELIRNAVPVLILIHIILVLVFLVRRQKGTLLPLVLSGLYIFFALTMLFPIEARTDLAAQIDISTLQKEDFGAGLPPVWHRRIMLPDEPVDLFLIEAAPIWSKRDYQRNALLHRRLATYMKHLPNRFLLITSMQSLPVSEFYRRIVSAREQMVAASSDTLRERIVKIFCWQRRQLLFTASPELLSDPRVREALQSSSPPDLFAPVPQAS